MKGGPYERRDNDLSTPPSQKHDSASMKDGAQQCRDLLQILCVGLRPRVHTLMKSGAGERRDLAGLSLDPPTEF
jgi:hypothetical protein